MPYPLPLTRTEAYLAYKAGVIQQSDLKPSLAVPRNGIDAWLAYWTGLEADYPKNQDGTPMILQEEEAYIAYLCGVINEYPEKCLRRVGAYLRYLISARWGRPDHPLNREELYLSLIKTQFIPSGDPSSDIEIDGTAKAAFVDIKMYGDTFQQTYSGKNLFNRENYGTLVGWAAQGEIKNYGNRAFYIQCKPETTYTIQKMLARPVERSRCQIFTTADVPAVGGAVIGILFSTNDATQATVTTQSGANYLCVVCYEAVASTETTVQEMAGSIMIEEGATASPYEPYVGGQPSPNPDYPQDVQTVTGAQTVEIVGRNLFDKDNAAIHALNPVASGQALSPLTNACSTFIPITGGDTFTVSSTNRALLDTYASVYYISGTPDTATTWITRTSFGQNNSVTTTAPAEATYLGIYFLYSNNQTTIANAEATIQIEKGSTATAYAPYSKHTYPINLGKNLLSAGLEVGGWLIGVGSTIEKTTNNNAYRCNAPISVKPNTEYIFSINGEAFDSFRVVYANAAGVILSNEVFTGTIKTPDNCSQIVFYSSAMKSAYPNIEDIKAQLEVGNTVTSYAEYFTPIELCKLDTYQDYIWKDGESWKVHKANGYYALTDSVSITPGIDTSKPNTTRFQFTNILAEPSSTSGRSSLKCSHFKYVSMWNTDVVGIQLADYAQESLNTRFWFRIPKTIATTFNQLKSWLTNNPVELYYPLATPTDTVITDSTLISQLEALVKGGSEDGTTYIKLSTPEPNLPGLLYVEAAKYV